MPEAEPKGSLVILSRVASRRSTCFKGVRLNSLYSNDFELDVRA